MIGKYLTYLRTAIVSLSTNSTLHRVQEEPGNRRRLPCHRVELVRDAVKSVRVASPALIPAVLW
ncbi:hypothetical protein QUB78_18360 [Microcoleus sp. ARI1-A4]|uniref:hypothetical protein n=1 Tax=Microcoleus sp. ARI1-A2 TaxID=2818557 RepID=UPI002FD50A90